MYKTNLLYQSTVLSTLTRMDTPNGHKTHKSYPIEIIMLSLTSLEYISKFPIPVGTKLQINIAAQDHELCLKSIVSNSLYNLDGRYKVYCANDFLLWSAKDKLTSIEKSLKYSLSKYLN
ncbi:hypothetical protein [Dendrosporobacter sp. 1207_IL3150]|uniref:hypothetical protein n=1 Tax=Dendrosporobacter sp. 1207_IL3150 TaxID=3084054 RepID=UPI002FD98043